MTKLKFKIKAEADELERSSHGKLICPLCDERGVGAYWWSLHRVKPHVECKDCHQVFLMQGITRHRRFCKERRKP